MTTGEKIARLRKEQSYTQEQLAALLGVSRQAISKWESDGAWPETDKLIRLSELFGCTVDYLLKESITDPGSTAPAQSASSPPVFWGQMLYGHEYISPKKVWGMPLVHISWSHTKVSRGFFAIGLRAKGIFALGFLPLGVVSFGLLPVGVLSFGTFAIGLLAFGAFALGLVAAGAITLGALSLGAVANGLFASGALGNGFFAAFGDEAYSQGIAIGQSWAEGGFASYVMQPRMVGQPRMFLGNELDYRTLVELKELVVQQTPGWLRWLAHIFNLFY